MEVLNIYLKSVCEIITVTGDDSRSLRKIKMKQIESGNFQVLITTGQLLGEGLDMENLSSIFLVYPFAFEGKLIQYIGRILRSKGRKFIYDYRDKEIEFLLKLYKRTESDILKEGGTALFIKTDVSNSLNVKNMVSRTVKKFGGLHILYDNAAVFWYGKDGNVTDISEDIWDKVININLKGTFLCCKYAIPEIIKSGGGSVINTSSSTGLIGIPKCDAYTATKGAVSSLTRSIGVEFVPYKV
ncbi:hypothetical protein ES703_80583 [subsurface metagenome]